MDEDGVERRRLGERRVDHRQECGLAVVRRAAAELSIVLHRRLEARPTVALNLAALVRNRQIALNLLAGRNREIAGDAECRRSGRQRGRCGRIKRQWMSLVEVIVKHALSESMGEPPIVAGVSRQRGRLIGLAL